MGVSRLLLLVACFVALLAVSPAGALAGSTGGTAPGSPAISDSTRELWTAAQQLGARELHRGARGKDVQVLQRVLVAVGYPGPTNGTFGLGTARQVKSFQRAHHLKADGKVGAQTAGALLSALEAANPALRRLDVAAGADGWVFPIRGAHNYGTAVNRYGAPRTGHTHAGQDVLSACGLRLVAARAGKVVGVGTGGDAGNYLAVHTTDTPYDYFYAHLRSRALVREGETVRTGQLVGYVGETGDATTCHLHIELWRGRWWDGGHTVDPLPFLRVWDRSS